jgi:hypothetical protein
MSHANHRTQAQIISRCTADWNRIRNLRFSHVQAIVGTLAGVVSVAGALFSVVQFVRPTTTGKLVTVVQEAGSRRALTDAAVEVLTTDNALVATLAPDTSGRAIQALREGVYIVRVSHPRYSSEVRQIQVLPHQTVEVRATLRADSSSPADMDRAVSSGLHAIRRALHF